MSPYSNLLHITNHRLKKIDTAALQSQYNNFKHHDHGQYEIIMITDAWTDTVYVNL